MDKIFILQLLFGVVGGILQFWPESEKKSEKPDWIFISFKQKGSLFCVVVLVVLSYWKDSSSDYELRASKIQDSIKFENAQIQYNKKLDSTEKELIGEFTKALVTYGLDYKKLHDSSSRKITELIRDSARKTIIEEVSPIFGPVNPGFMAKRIIDSIRYEIYLFNQNAPSIVNELNAHILILNSYREYEYVTTVNYIKSHQTFFKDSPDKRSGYIKRDDFNEATQLFFYFTGTYSDIKKKDTFSIEAAYYTNLGDSTFGSILSDPYRSEVKNLLKNIGIIK